LILALFFWLNRPVPASAQNGAVAFTTTQWSVVLKAQGESPLAEEALEKLCRIYWWTLYGFVRRQGYSPEEAQDLTQGFFAMLLERRDFDAVRRETGRLRSYLLASLKNFLAKVHRRATTIKRGEGRPLGVRLRSERSGTGNGRIYTITITCLDSAGNKTVKTTQVRVPH
jgi:hypothetical protein